MKLLRVGGLRPVFKPKRYTTVVAVLVVGAGIASATFAAVTSHLQQREYLVGRAQTISDTLPLEEIEKLKGSQTDVSTLEYAHIKQALQQVSNSNTDIARIHLFVIRDNHVQVAADAKTPDAAGYVSPGSNFSEASESLRATFKTNQPTHDNLASDYAGHWVAAYTPIYDVQTGKTIGVVGIFKSARNYYLEIALYALVPLLLAAIPLAGVLRDIKIEAKEHEILQLKSQFVSIASHELRSPLAGMLWAIHSLSQNSAKKLNLEQLGLLSDMYRSTESSLATVNEILDLSIFERGQSHNLQHDVLDFGTIVKQVVATLKLGAGEKHISIEAGGDWPAHVRVVGDLGAIKRALMNVISNAIKYSPDKSTISIVYRLSGKEHIIGVQDTGIGIPADEQDKVLQGYYRATNATNVQANGTGLGLWVSKKIIEENGGRLWLNSRLDHGTTVFISLPVANEVPTRPQPVKSAGSKTPDQDSSPDKP